MFAATLLALACYCVSDASASKGDDRSALNALADLYEENWAKFNAGRVWFEYTDGYAKTVGDAIKGDLTDAYKAEGFYAFKASNAAYHCLYADEALIGGQHQDFRESGRPSLREPPRPHRRESDALRCDLGQPR